VATARSLYSNYFGNGHFLQSSPDYLTSGYPTLRITRLAVLERPILLTVTPECSGTNRTPPSHTFCILRAHLRVLQTFSRYRHLAAKKRNNAEKKMPIISFFKKPLIYKFTFC
jgi:hypothetical protein